MVNIYILPNAKMPSDFINGRCMIDVLDEALDTVKDNGKKRKIIRKLLILIRKMHDFATVNLQIDV